MARFDSEAASRYIQFLDNEIGKEVQVVQNEAHIGEEEKNYKLDVLDEVKERMLFEYGLDNYEL